MSQAKYKKKRRKIQAGERKILEYNDLEESFNQVSNEDVQYVFDKHFEQKFYIWWRNCLIMTLTKITSQKMYLQSCS